MQEVVIVAATRTAIGSFQGALASIPAPELGAAVIRQLLAQTGLAGDQVDEVILGQVLTAGSGQNPARQASILAGPASCRAGADPQQSLRLGPQGLASGRAGDPLR